MKRSFLTTTLVLLSLIAFGQVQEKSIRFSLVGSPSLNWLKSDLKENARGPLFFGYYAGVEFDYFFDTNYSFSTGLNIQSTGGSLIYADQNIVHFDIGADTLKAGTKLTYQLRYLDIPLGLKFTSGEIGYSTIYADVGLNLLFNTKATATATDNNIVKEPLTDEISLFNIGYHVEGGVMYSFGNNLSLIVGLEYRSTFLDMTNDLGAPKPDNTYINQVGLKLGLAF